MAPFRTPIAHLFLWLGLVAWVLGLGARLVHEAEVAHAVCAEHGERVELVRDGPTLRPQSPAELSSDPAGGDHDHDCALQAVVVHATLTDRAPTLLPPAPRVRLAVAPHRTRHARAPPLRYAPKTSPPRC